ncbi:hypothetical protein JMJ77_0007240 [Colletotrichum scovillei]|uniref:HET domain-containing protein n=1 Tax=Colletotrichum scovillei TaxID=1209932 RepID=A0A9P7REX7_9PEZI|nr:hypothetical protein JMJ77_0007240 [Colletotrichum scovillei]KAG7074208.1 hypothetical protein JMJ76_0010692 [Colletotrichum scovillei]KAG7081327.1 hypothetical protein JMJ78_0003451 [Colletotrichum scovillei]
MWLINVDTLQLEEFIEPDFPYAILSHTWGGEEVSFQELKTQRDDDVWKKAGYLKISNSCRVAKSLELNYVWVDTCCIDKTSSAELSEAINSMFRWYNRSWVCFAYLSDMDDLASSDTFLESLGDSRWFTRGWTLQELLAPKAVTFYNASWQLLGSKESLSPFLSSITGIDEAILIGKAPLLKVPVATRMSWASKRQTTRTEDSAYCLLGIFDINMPLLYGEGEKAFARLQFEILQETNDLSLLAWTSSATDPERQEEYSGLLAKSPSNFSVCSNLKLIDNIMQFEDFEVTMTKTKISIQTILWYLDDLGHKFGTQDEAGYVLPLHYSFLDPGFPKTLPLNRYDASFSTAIGVVIAKTPSGFIRHKPWSLIAKFLGSKDNSTPSLPDIRKLKVRVSDEKPKPLKLVRHLTSEAALDLQSTRLKNAIFVSVDTHLINNGPFGTLHAQPKALWDGLNGVFLDNDRRRSVRNMVEARFLQFSLRSGGEKVILVCAIVDSMFAPSVCRAALLNYEEDEMGRWMIDHFGESDETSTSYTTATRMLDMVIGRSGRKFLPSWPQPAITLCPIEYFAESTAPASRNIRLSDGTEKEVTVSIIPHDAAEGAYAPKF